MSTTREKRNISDVCNIWKDLVAHIVEALGQREQQGFVHTSLCWDENRLVQIGGRVQISENTLLMKIPARCLIVSPSSDERTSYEQSFLFSSNCQIDSTLKTDLAHAMCLAVSHKRHRNYLIEKSKRHESEQLSFEFEHNGPYLNTLPRSDSYNGLPRRWPEHKLRYLLGGTDLLRRVFAEKSILMEEYESAKGKWYDKNCSNIGAEAKGPILQLPGDDSHYNSACTYPSFEEFDDAFAAVCSRGFAGLGKDDGSVDTLVPLLDLLDHRRGNSKNVRYERRDGCVHVHANQDLQPGDVLYDTYGAKGNSVLLFRYGFCLENNHEPDGSCNDFVRFRPKKFVESKKKEEASSDANENETKTNKSDSAEDEYIDLRAGPKSYTALAFIRLVDCFVQIDSREKSTSDEKTCSDGGKDGDGSIPNEDDFEAFLNGCEDEDELDSEDEEGLEDCFQRGQEEIAREMKGLEKMSKALEEALLQYTFLEKAEIYLLEKGTPEYFAAILVTSEGDTLKLYLEAAKRLSHTLLFGSCPQNKVFVHNNRYRDFSNELVSAYNSIRHQDQLKC